MPSGSNRENNQHATTTSLRASSSFDLGNDRVANFLGYQRRLMVTGHQRRLVVRTLDHWQGSVGKGGLPPLFRISGSSKKSGGKPPFLTTSMLLVLACYESWAHKVLRKDHRRLWVDADCYALLSSSVEFLGA